MEARHLRYAVALAEHQHFGRAAAALGIAQPPLSKQIGDLERELGARLFNRTPHGVFPTAAGTAFLHRARRALTEMSAAVVDAGRAARGETGRLRLGFIGSAVLELLPSVLSRFGREHPDVRMALHEMSSARGSAALLAGDLDIAITRGAPRGAGAENLVSVSVGQDRLIAVVGLAHPHAGQRKIHVDQLRTQPLIVAPPEEEPATLATISDLLGERTMPLGGTIEARDVHTIVGLAACGIGVGLGPSCMRMAARPDVRFLDVVPRTELPPLVMSYRAGDPGPVLGAYLDVTRELCPNVRGLR
ncbi:MULTISPECIES: LysR family transcriptional regulator [unclassified Crossiella]|uniref:LysR family transcriptional regulator n=1 Tax=unclassified Crossiella TaxID=2620835 RepID=UPI001FFF0C2E|nr:MULTISPECIES: LysR family transcriptional regulator [unclassified Crossiella]MCK2244185.1 LysR family transcriptional regulator [Crossiella sp. S99.2]MCK2257989.1 LysR family transcriptional regulator [Crossiella sp. S99.1]